MKIVGIIPSRYESSRFIGKPLADISGKPMIWWVYNHGKQITELSDIFVATDDKRISDVCDKYDINYIMTSKEHKNGTDRAIEVSKKIDADLYLVLMGDEPLIDPKDVSLLLKDLIKNKKYDAGMLATKFKNCVDVVNTTTIKLAINDKDELIYMSRSPIPFPKEDLNFEYYKNMGAYVYTKECLNLFEKVGMGNLEKIEGLEMIRLLENHQLIKIVKVESDSMSVDSPKDLTRIIDIMDKRIQDNKEQL